MNKRFITVLLTMLTVVFLTGCNGDQKAVTETVEGFLNAMVANDLEAVAQYASEDFMESETMKLMDPQYLADSFYATMDVAKEDMSEETQKAVDDYVNQVVAKAYESFEIQDIKVQENTAAVTTKITLGYNPDEGAQIPEETIDLIDAYQSEHYDELIAIYTDKGENAMYNKLYNDLIPIVIGKMQEQLEQGTPTEEKTILTLEKRDGKWVITNLEENLANAAAANHAEAGDTSGEAASAATASVSTEYAAESATSDESASEYSTSEE